MAGRATLVPSRFVTELAGRVLLHLADDADAQTIGKLVEASLHGHDGEAWPEHDRAVERTAALVVALARLALRSNSRLAGAEQRLPAVTLGELISAESQWVSGTLTNLRRHGDVDGDLVAA